MMIYHSNMRKGQTIKHIELLQDSLVELRVKCGCGHTLTMPVQLDYKICTNCGSKVRNNSKAYFKYKLRKVLNENKN